MMNIVIVDSYENIKGVIGGGCLATDEEFYAIIKTHKRRSNKIYNSELTMTKI